MSKQLTILVTGLTMSASKALAPGMDVVAFEKAMNSSISTLSNLPNLQVHRFDLDNRQEASSAESIDAFKSVLRERQYDGHIIGAGLKKIPQLLPLFELLINETSSVSNGKTKLLFSADGADHVDVVKRGFPQLQ